LIKNNDREHHMLNEARLNKWAARLLVAGALAGLLAACGGGSTDGCASLDPTRDTNLPGCAALAATGTATDTFAGATPDIAVATPATLALVLTDASGAAVTSLAPERAGTLRATIKDTKGNPVQNTAVTFTSTDKSATFVPASGTALTDALGVARIGVGAGNQSGAFTASASAAVNSVAATGTTSYSVAFPALTLSAIGIAPTTLSANGNASIKVDVSSGSAPYMLPLQVFLTSPCSAAGKATITSPVLTQGGTANASYTDNGCGVADTITASLTFGGNSVTRSGTITVLPASAGSINFISASRSNIALKGTGGFGRQEFSNLLFRVFDKAGNAVANSVIDLVFSDSNTTSTTGGLMLNTGYATSNADGDVTVLVSAGTIPTSVRVVASVRGSSPLITTSSNILVISTGIPDQRHFSLATETGNCEGLDFNQPCSIITATLGDHFGNPVPDGSAVNFTTEGGIIDASCVTGTLPAANSTGLSTDSKVGPGSGTCSVLLRASNPRPADGLVTVLAYASGEEAFFDANGNNIFDSGDVHTDKSPDIFRDDNEDRVWNPGEPCIGPNLNGLCSTPGDGQYNGVLRTPQSPSAQTLYVSAQLVQTFSGSIPKVTFSTAALTCTPGGSADVQVTVTDLLDKLMPAGTSIEFQVLFGTTVGTVFPNSINVPNVIPAVGEAVIVPTYAVTVACLSGSGKLITTVTTPVMKKVTIVNLPIN
jgi:hypothetical protein